MSKRYQAPTQIFGVTGLLLVTIAILLQTHCSYASSGSEPDAELERIHISRVDPLSGRIYFSLFKPNGSPLTAMQSQDFEFSLDGTPIRDVTLRSFADDPLAKLIVVFGFGSAHMTRNQSLNVVAAAGRHFLVDMSESKPDRAALLTFADEVAVPAHFSADPIKLKRELRRLKQRGRSVRYFDGLRAAAQLIENTDTAAFGALVFAVDQRDTVSHYDLKSLEQDARAGRFPPVYSIGIGHDSALTHDLSKVALHTGGASFMISPHSNRLAHTYATILDILEHQYVATIGVPLLSGVVEIVFKSEDGSRIVAQTALPSAPQEPDRIPTHAPLRRRSDWRQVTLMLVLGGLLLSLGLLRMGYRPARLFGSRWLKSKRPEEKKRFDARH